MSRAWMTFTVMFTALAAGPQALARESSAQMEPGTESDAPGGDRSAWSVTAGFGPTLNDLEVHGVEWTAYAGTEWRRLRAPLVLEGTLRLFTYDRPRGSETILLPEISIQVEPSWKRVRPYAGVGGGLSWVDQHDLGSVSAAWHLALGSRWTLTPVWFLNTGARLRSVEPIGEATVGVGLRLP